MCFDLNIIKFRKCDNDDYDFSVKSILFISIISVYVSFTNAFIVSLISLSNLLKFLLDKIFITGFYVSELVITTIAYIGFTLSVVYVSTYIGNKFVLLIDYIKMKEKIKKIYIECRKDKNKGDNDYMSENERKTTKNILILICILIYLVFMVFGTIILFSVNKNTNNYALLLIIGCMLYSTYYFIIAIKDPIIKKLLIYKGKHFKN